MFSGFECGACHHAMFAHRSGHQHQIDICGSYHLLEIGGEALVAILWAGDERFAIFFDVAGHYGFDQAPLFEEIDLA